MTGGEHERRFALFGSEVRILVGSPATPGAAPPEFAATEAETFLRVFDRRLTRFRPDSELARLNADPRDAVPVSSLVAVAVMAARFAAEQTDGLADPTLVTEIERAGYAESRVGLAPVPLGEALAVAPPARPASARSDERWRAIDVDPAGSIVTRPPGLRIDVGGSGKGLAADLASAQLAGYELHVVDAGGDLRIGGARPRQRLVEVRHPLRDEPAFAFQLAEGGVATSGLKTRVWSCGDRYSHHLLDPSTGTPAWTGVIQATAVAGSALRAEALAKAALLSGPRRGREMLAPFGGVLVLDDGTIDVVGKLAEPEIETHALKREIWTQAVN